MDTEEQHIAYQEQCFVITEPVLQICRSNSYAVVQCFTSHEVLNCLFAGMQIAIGKDADLLLLDKFSLKVSYVYAKGQLVRTPDWTRGGMFERGQRIRPIKPNLHA